MYHLIVSNRGVVENASPFTTFSVGVTRIQFDDISQSVQFLADQGLPGAGTAGQILSFVNKIPWGKMSAMFKKDEDTPTAEEIDIPSVSQMTKFAKIRFIRTRGGIRDIRFDEEEKKLYLPSIRVSGTSEMVLRNLVAYEAATAEAGARLEVAEYVDLMCGIIDSGKDVEILREERILESELDDEEIAGIFNGISKSEKKKKGDDKTKVEEAIESVNRGYSSLVRVKVGKFVYASFKFMSVVITIAVLLLLTLQAFCSVFGCSRWFHKTDAFILEM